MDKTTEQHRHFVVWLFISVCCFIGSSPFSSGQPASPSNLSTVTMGVVIDGPWQHNARIQDLFVTEIRSLLAGDYDVLFSDDLTMTADWTVPNIKAALDRLYADPNIDIVIANGVIASDLVCHWPEPLPKPTVAPYGLDVELQQLPIHGESSGMPNLCYITMREGLGDHLRLLKRFIAFDQVTVLGNPRYLSAVPMLRSRPQLVGKELGLRVDIVPAQPSVSDTLAALPPETELVYVGPVMPFSETEYRELAAGLIARGLPSFAILERREVEAGILAGFASEDYFLRTAKRTALNVRRILGGRNPSEIPVFMPDRTQLLINMATARAINIWPTWDILMDAELIHSEPNEPGRRMTLTSVIREAIAHNLSLAVQGQFVASGLQEVRKARANLFPQLQLGAQALAIDKDRARASFGSQAEHTVGGSARFSQIIFSEDIRANVDIQELQQANRQYELEQLKLDITQEAVVAYLNVLRAQTFLQIQRKNLELTRSNLELARLRKDIGSSGPAEVYRWENHIATDKKNLLAAQTQLTLAEYALNRLLNRPLADTVRTAETGINDPNLLVCREEMVKHVQTPHQLRVVGDFFVKEGIANAFEVKQIDAAIAAQKRNQRASERAFYLPSVSAQAGVDQDWYEEGAGSGGLPGPLAGTVSPADDTDWNAALVMSFPLYSGGAKLARREQAVIELGRLRKLRQSTTEQLEQRIRSALQVAATSWTNIQLSRDAAEAADNNLKVIRDAYSQGLVSILELLDAQNASLTAQELAYNAEYDFLIDLMEVDRSISFFHIMATEVEQRAWIAELQAFVNQQQTNTIHR